MAEYENCSDQAGGQIITERLCQPCGIKHVTMAADTYCDTCAEFQCKECSKVHNMYSFMKGHKLKQVNQSQPSELIVEAVDMKGIDMCVEHSKQFLYFCVDDDMLLCSSCILSKHRRCENIHELDSENINSQSKNISKQDLRAHVGDLKSSANTMLQDLHDAKQSIGHNLEDVTNIIDIKRDLMIQKFEELKVNITSNISKTEQESEKKIDDIATKSSDKIDKITTLHEILPDVLDHGTLSQTFILHHVVAKQAMAFQRFKDENTVEPCTFVLEISQHLNGLLAPDHELATLINGLLTVQGTKSSVQSGANNFHFTSVESDDNTGNSKTTTAIKLEEKATQTEDTSFQNQPDGAAITPVISPGPMKLDLMHNIYLNEGSEDRDDPFYSGMDFLPDGRLVVLDGDHAKMLIYSESLIQLKSYRLRGRSNDIAVISRDEVAVTDGDFSQIQFFRISKSNHILLLRSVSTSTKCESVSLINPTTLLVSTYDDKQPMRMISLNGEEEDFVNIKQKQFKFDNNKCTYVSKANMLALTDRYAHTVYLYTRNGKHVTWQAVKDVSLIEFPRGICEGPDNSVIVCSEGTDSLVQLSTSGTILASLKLKMLAPYSVCMSKDGKRLAVSNCEDDRRLQVYQINQ